MPILLIASMLAAQDQPQEPSRLKESGIAARINHEIITAQEMEAIYREAGVRAEDAELRKALLQKEAQRRLFLQEAKKLDVEVTKEELDKSIETVIRNLGGEDAYDRWLARRQMTRAQQREDQRLQLLVQRVFNLKYRQWMYEPGSDAPPLHDFVSPEEMKAYYDANPKEFNAPESVTVLRVTLRYRTDAERLEAVTRAESIRRKVQDGFTSFEAIAKIETPRGLPVRIDALDCGSDLFKKETIDKLFAIEKPGQISDILEEGGAVHLFQLLEHASARSESFIDAQPKIRTYLQVEKQRANRELLLREMLKNAYFWPRDLFE